MALKKIRNEAFAEEQDLARFQREAEAVARLQHPHIVQIYDYGEHKGSPYIAMEFMEGGNLAEHLSGRPLPAVDASQLVETLARTMHYAHEQKIIHRDLKPAKICLRNCA